MTFISSTEPRHIDEIFAFFDKEFECRNMRLSEDRVICMRSCLSCYVKTSMKDEWSCYEYKVRYVEHLKQNHRNPELFI